MSAGTDGDDAAPVPPAELHARVRAAGRRARASGALVPLDTRVRLVPDGGITFLVRVSQNVARKEAAATSSDAAPPADPFMPPYDPDLYVGDVSATHAALLNKYNVLDDHVLLVTRAWAEQTAMLDSADFEAMLLGLAGIDGLAFYNGGTEAGASQPHKHLQVVPLPLAPEGPALPIADAFAHARLGDQVGHVPALPFRHALTRVQPAWLADPATHARDARAAAAALWRALGHDPGAAYQPVPYNLLATRRWMWLVPRRLERWEGLPVNALAFAGALLAGDEAAFGRLCAAGPMAALAATGEPADEADPPLR
ncbi:MAG: hypothetical protein U5K43_00735 [Halofilum sp. (in: g-proteobacteria)]|nr:hypothetical protein [Halofilum sp. (in: g-proteobacteria)]